MRVVSLCPSNTEIAWALDLPLVGVDADSDFPPSVAALPRVGRDLQIDVAAVAALAPDLVLSSTSVPGMERIVEGLDDAGVRHLVVDAQSLDDVLRSVLLVGRACGVGGRARAVVEDLRARLAAVEARGAALARRAKVYLEWWPKPAIVPGARCWTADLVRLAGGESLFADLDVRSKPVPYEDVVARAPDLLLTCWCGVPHERQRPDLLAKRPGWDELPAVVAGRVYAAEERLIARPGPRLVEGAEWLVGVLEEIDRQNWK